MRRAANAVGTTTFVVDAIRRESGVEADNRVSQAVVAPQLDPSVYPPISPEELFPDFPETYRRLVRALGYAGATLEEAEDAVMNAVTQALWRERRRQAGLVDLDPIDDPPKWAARAALSHFYKEKTRGLQRIRDQLVKMGATTTEGGEDQRMSLWGEEQWVQQLLDSLPAKQREVMTLVLEGLSPTEIAGRLGAKPGTVRQNLRDARTRLKQALQQEPGG